MGSIAKNPVSTTTLTAKITKIITGRIVTEIATLIGGPCGSDHVSGCAVAAQD
jgi:hypothetical protein